MPKNCIFKILKLLIKFNILNIFCVFKEFVFIFEISNFIWHAVNFFHNIVFKLKLLYYLIN